LETPSIPVESFNGEAESKGKKLHDDNIVCSEGTVGEEEEEEEEEDDKHDDEEGEGEKEKEESKLLKALICISDNGYFISTTTTYGYIVFNKLLN